MMTRIVAILFCLGATASAENADSIAFGSNSVGTMSILPHLSATRITADDIQNETTGTLTSKVNPGTWLNWTLDSGQWHFLLFLDVLYTEIRSPGAKGLDDRATGLGAAGFGIGYHFADNLLTATLFHSYTQALFIRGKTETLLALEKLTVPELGVQIRTVPFKSGALSVGAEGTVRVTFSVRSENLEYRNGWGIGGKAFAQWAFNPKLSLETGPYVNSMKHNTPLVDQAVLEVGWLGGFTWTFN